MKDYLLLIRGGDARMAELSEEERGRHMQDWGAFMGQLSESGNLTGGLPLTEDSRLLRKDGHSSEMLRDTNGEAVGGYLLLKANDYDHAIELTKSCPVFDHDGSVEIREAMHMDM